LQVIACFSVIFTGHFPVFSLRHILVSGIYIAVVNVAYLLKAKTVEPEKQPLPGNSTSVPREHVIMEVVF
jgi:hypothetical protein